MRAVKERNAPARPPLRRQGSHLASSDACVGTKQGKVGSAGCVTRALLSLCKGDQHHRHSEAAGSVRAEEGTMGKAEGWGGSRQAVSSQ